MPHSIVTVGLLNGPASSQLPQLTPHDMCTLPATQPRMQMSAAVGLNVTHTLPQLTRV
jgi:hypothetical protein